MKNRVRALLTLSLVAGSVLSASAADVQQAVAVLDLRAGTVDTSAANGVAALRAQAIGTRMVVQLDGPITPERRTRMEAAGLKVGDYLPPNAYIVTTQKADAAAGLNFIRWSSPYQNSWKLDPDLGKGTYATAERQALSKAARDLVIVTVFAGVDAGAVERSIWAIPGTVIVSTDPGAANHMELTVEVAHRDTARIAAIPGVQFIERAPEATPRSNLTTRWIVQSNVAGSFPLYANGLRGEGQIIGILDGRVDVNHCSFLDAAPIGPTHRKIVAMQTSGAGNSHGTHVAGIAVGDGNVEDNNRGVAYLGKLSWGTYGAVTAAEFNTGINFNRAAGARVHTNSWGNDGTTAYDALARAVDDQTYNNEDDMICFAVSNGSVVTNPENAKNVLAVGNDGDTPNQGTICTGGTGPTGQGLRKPEIWAPGCSTASSASGTACGTTNLTGTSMASPAIGGTALLVRQYFTSGYYPTGVNGTGTAFTPSGALIRAALLNSSVDMTGIPGYPTNAEGWGRVLADNSLYFPGDARKLLIQDVRNNVGLSTGAEATVNVNVLGSAQQLRITLAFTEPPGTAGSATPNVNNLDLEVTAPNGVTYKGNVFDTVAQNSIAGGVADAKNTIEQVHVASPVAGAWVVKVRGAAVAQALQGYALVVTGDIASGTPPPIIISLPGGIPSLIPPGVPTDVTVRVTPGSQSVVPGSPTMFYRATGAGAYASSPLTSLGGNDYRATLPSPLCGNTPQFYFSAQGSGGATALSPSTAPTNVHSTIVGTTSTNTLLTVDFDQTLPSGWTATGLWHLTGACVPGGTPCAGPRWAAYGQDSNCTYNTGVTNSGTLSLAGVSLPAIPPGGSINLSFCSALITENLAGWDKAEVLVNGAAVTTVGDSANWTNVSVDLSTYANQTVTLGFRFDTVDGSFNDFRGWSIDNVRITATGTTCTNPNTCYPNCDQSTAVPVLNANDFNCFLNAFAAGQSYANCDNSTTAPVLNANDFNCFLNSYAAGCP